jgi:hypothetical protein
VADAVKPAGFIKVDGTDQWLFRNKQGNVAIAAKAPDKNAKIVDLPAAQSQALLKKEKAEIAGTAQAHDGASKARPPKPPQGPQPGGGGTDVPPPGGGPTPKDPLKNPKGANVEKTIDRIEQLQTNVTSSAKSYLSLYDSFRNAKPGSAGAEKLAAAKERLSKAQTTLFAFQRKNVWVADEYGKEKLNEVRDYWKSLGVDAKQGNDGKYTVNWNVFDINAWYRPGDDSLGFGVVPETKKDLYNAKGKLQQLAFSKDVVAHEYAHRMLFKIAPDIKPFDNAFDGALHESLGDTMAMVVDGDWTMAEDVQRVPGGMVRHGFGSLNKTLKHWKDKDDVHNNGHVLNSAARRIGLAIGREKMGQIYADVIKNSLNDVDNVDDFAEALADSAKDLYGEGSAAHKAVIRAWNTMYRGIGQSFTG